jgi:hypothetical protein
MKPEIYTFTLIELVFSLLHQLLVSPLLLHSLSVLEECTGWNQAHTRHSWRRRSSFMEEGSTVTARTARSDDLI